jgi:hypothetical protein
MEDKDGNRKNYFYDNDMKLIRVEDHQNNVFNFAYGPDNKLVSVTGSADNTVAYEYAMGQAFEEPLLTAIDTGANASLTRREFEYNDMDKLSAKQLAGGLNRVGTLYPDGSTSTNIFKAVNDEECLY